MVLMKGAPASQDARARQDTRSHSRTNSFEHSRQEASQRDFEASDVAERSSPRPRRRRYCSRSYEPSLYPDYYTPYHSRRDRPRDQPHDSRVAELFEGITVEERNLSALVSSMADMDVGSGDRYRGSGYRGGGNKRRRDDEDDYHYSPGGRGDRRGPQRRRYDDAPPRRRYEEPAHAKLRRTILNIASSTKLPQDEAIEIAEYLRDHFDEEDARGEFYDTLLQLIVEQPFKIPFVAAVIFYGNQAKIEIASEAIKLVGDRLQETFNAGQWKEFKLFLRFFACLQPLFEEDGIFALLGQLFDTVVDLQSANENDVVGIELVKIILLTIPYALVSGGSRYHEKAGELLSNTGIVAGNMVPMESLIHTYDNENEDKVIGYHSIIGILQQQLTKESENGWEIACIPKFDAEALQKKQSEDTLPTAPPTHAFPTFIIPSPVNPGPKPLFPEAYFSLFANHENGTVPKTEDIAASLIRDAIVDTIDQLDFNREAAAKFLIELDSYWSLDTFAKRGTPFDKFREVVGDKVMYKSEDMIIDAIFSQLFKLPTADHKLVYYHSLITSCCKLAPQAIAPSLGRAIRTVYQSLHVLDLELTYRFLDWFTHHLSNFEFRWRWAEWIGDLELSNLQPKKAFIIAALDKEIRLSFAKRIRSTLPQEMNELIPARLDEDNSPEFKYDNPVDVPYSAQAKELIQQLKKKAPAEEVQKTIDQIHDLATEQGVADVLIPSTDAFVTAICRLGAKSLAHVLSCIERGKDRLIEVAQTSEAARRQIVASVFGYWKDQPGVAVRIIDILLNYTILAPMTVIQWVLGENLGAGEGLAESWVYEIVSITIAKVSSRNRQIVNSRVVKGLPQDMIDMVEATLSKDRDAARELFKYLEDVLRAFAQGSTDRLMEKEMNGEISKEDSELIKAWGKRWHTVFVRKSAVEESVVGEQAVEARIKLLAAEPDPEPEAMETEVANGDATEDVATNGD
ncbi:hypothetical protein PSPO01_03911 [Paraphaeosphaeria sporulosa]